MQPLGTWLDRGLLPGDKLFLAAAAAAAAGNWKSFEFIDLLVNKLKKLWVYWLFDQTLKKLRVYWLVGKQLKKLRVYWLVGWFFGNSGNTLCFFWRYGWREREQTKRSGWETIFQNLQNSGKRRKKKLLLYVTTEAQFFSCFFQKIRRNIMLFI